jgi:hypothetical protein
VNNLPTEFAAISQTPDPIGNHFRQPIAEATVRDVHALPGTLYFGKSLISQCFLLNKSYFFQESDTTLHEILVLPMKLKVFEIFCQ